MARERRTQQLHIPNRHTGTFVQRRNYQNNQPRVRNVSQFHPPRPFSIAAFRRYRGTPIAYRLFPPVQPPSQPQTQGGEGEGGVEKQNTVPGVCTKKRLNGKSRHVAPYYVAFVGATIIHSNQLQTVTLLPLSASNPLTHVKRWHKTYIGTFQDSRGTLEINKDDTRGARDKKCRPSVKRNDTIVCVQASHPFVHVLPSTPSHQVTFQV